MKTKIICCTLLFLFSCLKCNCQNDIESIINEILDKQNGTEENNVYEDLYEYLTMLADNPININTAGRRELEQFPLLNQYQIENLLEYRYDYGNLLSVYELNLIEGFDTETVRLCQIFFSFDQIGDKEKTRLKDIFKQGKNKLYGKVHTTVQKKKGYLENKYDGSPFGGYLKYKFNHKKLSFSLTCEHDAGESFIKNKGFDFYSAHVMLKDMGACKAFLLGDYKLNFGQGLVLKSNASYGKNNDPGSLIQRQDAATPYTSSTEYGYFRGVANTWSIKNVDISGFFSYTTYTGNQNYHRNDAELLKKNSNKKIMAGGNINYYHKRFKIGLTAIHDLTNNRTNAGFDYRTRIGKFDLAGEIAINEKLKPAVLQSICFSPNQIISFSTLFRYYDPEYESEYGNAYCESGLNDEMGIMAGIGLKPHKNWNFSAYLDMFKFYKPKYGIYKPSDGLEFTFDINYLKNENFSLYGRYKLCTKDKNISMAENENTMKQTVKYKKHDFKVIYYAELLELMELNGGVNGSCYDGENKDLGWVIYNTMKINLKKTGLSFAAGISFFDIKEYSNRIYLYEKSLPYTYSSTMYYGEGLRTYFIVSYKTGELFSLNFKISHTSYSDGREKTGSGNEEIKGNQKTDMGLMAIFKF